MRAFARGREKTYAGAVSEFYYDGDQEVLETDGAGTTLRRYVRLPGSVDEAFLMIDMTLDAACTNASATACERWAHQNRLGSVVAATDSAGAVVEKYTYSPYGVSGAEGTSGFPFRFTGQKLDPETGLYYYKARYYDPETGRFLQTDPVGYDDQMNLYAYVANDPINKTDPTGECGAFILVCVGAAVGAVTNVVAQLAENDFDVGETVKNFDGGRFLAATAGGAIVGLSGSIGVLAKGAQVAGAARTAIGVAGAAINGVNRTVGAIGGTLVVNEANNPNGLSPGDLASATVDVLGGKAAGAALKSYDGVPSEFTENALSVVESVVDAIKPNDPPPCADEENC